MKIARLSIKKSQESLVSTKLISIILLVLVILGLLMFLIRPDILNWIRESIPSYSAPEDQIIDQSGIPSDQLIKGCEEQTAAIGSQQLGIIFGRNSRELFIYLENQNNPKLSSIYVADMNEKIWLLKIRNPSWKIWQSDFLVGQIVGGILTISSDIINNYDSSKIKEHVSLEELKRINGSFLYTETKLCKSK
jgi:hypothetical protein